MMPAFHSTRQSGEIWKLNLFCMSLFINLNKGVLLLFQDTLSKAYLKPCISDCSDSTNLHLTFLIKSMKGWTPRPSYLPHHSHTPPLVSHRTSRLWSSLGCGNRQGLNSNIISSNTVPPHRIRSVGPRSAWTPTQSRLGSMKWTTLWRTFTAQGRPGTRREWWTGTRQARPDPPPVSPRTCTPAPTRPEWTLGSSTSYQTSVW